MDKINWIQKLTSRKFWAAITGFVVSVLAFVNVDAGTTEKIVTFIGAIASLVAYIVAEGLIDAAREENKEE